MSKRPVAALLLVLTLLLTACGGDGEDGSAETTEPAAAETDAAAEGDGGATEMDTEAGGGDVAALSDGTLTVCTDSPYRPFEFEEDGEFTGFDIELVNAISEELGVEPEYRVTPFEGIQSGAALAAGQCDLAASAMTITEERAENLAFSEPYFDADQSLLVPADSDVTSLEDLSGMTLGVQASTTGAMYAQENAPEGTEIVEYPDAATLFTAMQSGEAAGALQDFPVNAFFATQNDGFEVVEQYTTGEQYGLAAALDNEALIQQVNDALTAVRDQGTYESIYVNWFGEPPGGGATESTES